MRKFYAKIYYELLDDSKMGKLPDKLWRRFVECILLAGEFDEGGFLPSVADIAWRLRMDEDVLCSQLDELAKVGILDVRPFTNGQPRWFVVNYAKRQKAVDGAERVRQHRQRALDNKIEEENKKREDIYIDTNVTSVVTKTLHKRYTLHNVHPEPVNQMVMAIEPLVKTALTASTEEQFVDAAYALIGWGATPSDLSGWTAYWETHCYYTPRTMASLKSFIDGYRDYASAKMAAPTVRDADGGFYG